MSAIGFIEKYANAAVAACKGTGLFPSVKLAQMALETGWGKSIPANNAFGIKATGKHTPYWKGDVYNAKTKEFYTGSMVTITDGFRAYKSIQDSIADHSYLLMSVTRYTAAGVFNAKTPEDQAKALKVGGYATDPNYANKLISIITKYNLKRFDAM